MFALAWNSEPVAPLEPQRLSASLAAGTSRVAGYGNGPGWAAARLFDHNDQRRARAWRITEVEGGLVLFAGFLSNAREIAASLGLGWSERPSAEDYARLYGLHRLKRGPDRELDLVGEYAAALIDPSEHRVTLVRSPLRAPPLHFRLIGDGIVAGSVPRVLFTGGEVARLNRLKLADNAWFNMGSEISGWHDGCDRVLPGTRVELQHGSCQKISYYDPTSLPAVRFPRLQDYVERAGELLDEAVSASLAGFNNPGILLSGGLDSALVAAKAVGHLPDTKPLEAFTFVPQADWDGRTPAGTFGDEGPAVTAFAAMHPRIRTHFFDNHGLGFDHRMVEMFHHTGIAPIGLANFSPYHTPFQAARQQGCDVILLPEWGNETFSCSGEWGLVEYLLTFRWGELAKALKSIPDDPRLFWRRLIGSSLLPLLPPAVWRWQRALRGIADKRELASPLRAEFVRAHNLIARGERLPSGVANAIPRNRREWLRTSLVSGADDAADIWQGFEQIHSVAIRDPAAYRPLAEFCFGLPTDLFLRGGERRWLARELGRGLMPEEQRTNRRSGRHNADWLAKLAPQREHLRQELRRLQDVPEFAEMLDIPRLLAALDDWPDETPVGMDAWALQTAVTRGVMLARFINWSEGRNLGP